MRCCSHSFGLILLVVLLIAGSACFRQPRLIEGLYITHDGRVEGATPGIVKGDWEQRLERAVRRSFGDDVRSQVVIEGDPQPQPQARWQWSELTVRVDAGEHLLHAQDLRRVILAEMRPVLAADVRLRIEGGIDDG
ncbi:MAG: hypothetical protein EA402_02985 [Planctomycetota bacterium]|nr:MAG: hypothetical protein EA402_02985 [Planctomycetota bacterium]